MPTPIFELRDLRVAVVDTDFAVRNPSFDARKAAPTALVADSGETLSQGWVEVIPAVSLSVEPGESRPWSGSRPQASP